MSSSPTRDLIHPIVHHDEPKRPEWTPDNAGREYAGSILSGITPPANQAPRKPKRRQFTPEELVSGILAQKRSMLSRAITMVESNAPWHRETADAVVKELLAHSGNSIRIGITGTPGAGKSTFIEALGTLLCEKEKKVAVLAVDPSSSLTQGSILGDKTRMEHLGRHPNAFIRPSPTGGNLGGVTRKSRESIVLCEAAGFDVILVETVGVGQNETTVRSMVDFFLLLMIAGGGDELQGIKKGVIELADAILINKADGENVARAEVAREEARRALHYLKPATPGWKPQALKCSSLTGDGVMDVWNMIENFQNQLITSGHFTENRNRQRLDWMYAMVEQQLIANFYADPEIQNYLVDIRSRVLAGDLPASAAATRLIHLFTGKNRH